MVEELAYHIFTDIELQGSVRWQATRTFCDGLRAYRDCLQTPKDRVANLQKAEKQLIRTLIEDTEFRFSLLQSGCCVHRVGAGGSG